jgi:hypothetical protein
VRTVELLVCRRESYTPGHKITRDFLQLLHCVVCPYTAKRLKYIYIFTGNKSGLFLVVLPDETFLSKSPKCFKHLNH